MCWKTWRFAAWSHGLSIGLIRSMLESWGLLEPPLSSQLREREIKPDHTVFAQKRANDIKIFELFCPKCSQIDHRAIPNFTCKSLTGKHWNQLASRPGDYHTVSYHGVLYLSILGYLQFPATTDLHADTKNLAFVFL